MKLSKAAFLITSVLILSTLSPPARAQDAPALKREIARLKLELADVRATCRSTGPAPERGPAAEQRIAALGFSVASIRVGPATGFAQGHTAVTTSITIRNVGRVPLALNYKSHSFAVVDNKGYEYKISDEYVRDGNAQYIKGLSIATNSRADTRDIISPGQSVLVTFIAVRYMRDGESAGNSFDINATFGEYADQGEGKVRHVRDYPVGFVSAAARR